jgi:hypothetical protein
MAPAISSANPPYTTTFVSPSADNPAVNAKGTVNPSERPMTASEITRPSILKPSFSSVLISKTAFSSDSGQNGSCDSTSASKTKGIQYWPSSVAERHVLDNWKNKVAGI